MLLCTICSTWADIWYQQKTIGIFGCVLLRPGKRQWRYRSDLMEFLIDLRVNTVGPEGRALKRIVAALHFLPRATAIAYKDVGEGREPGAEALPTKRVLHLHASDHAEAICN